METRSTVNTPKSLFSNWIEVQTGYSAKDISFSQITSDLGQRVYYRIQTPREPLVLCVYPNPIEPQNAFFEVHEFLAKQGFHVPSIFGKDYDRGLILLEDLGATAMSGQVKLSDFGKLTDLTIQLYQLRAARNPPACLLANALNLACFSRELQFTETHLLSKLSLDETELARFRKSTQTILQNCDSWINTFCHRDLHVNNLFLKNETIVLIDFQDMRRGFGGYDLFSILFERESLGLESNKDFLTSRLPYVEKYWSDTVKSEISYDEFLARFMATGIQRALKACGNFAKGSTLYSKYVEPSLTLAERLFGELAALNPKLKPALDQLARLRLVERWNQLNS